MTRTEANPRDLKKHPTHPNWTMPKSWGVWELPEGSNGKRYRYGNNPAKGAELTEKFGRATRLALYTTRHHAKAHAAELNEVLGEIMTTGQIQSTDGRSICYADYGGETDAPVLWCHGAPGSRLEPQAEESAARSAGIRLIGIDRPGYGASDPHNGRSIADWVSDALEVADQLNIAKFHIVGVSTGGAYALATASIAPDRVLGVLVCCGMTDMRWGETNAMLTASARVWETQDREHITAVVIEDFGEDGSKMMEGDDTAELLAPPDLALFADPAFANNPANNEPFANGVMGYVDDRIADGPTFGWSSFEIGRVNCPVRVIHGEQDRIVPIAHAHHTAEIVPNAMLQTYPQHGHLSVTAEIVPNLKSMLAK